MYALQNFARTVGEPHIHIYKQEHLSNLAKTNTLDKLCGWEVRGGREVEGGGYKEVEGEEGGGREVEGEGGEYKEGEGEVGGGREVLRRIGGGREVERELEEAGGGTEVGGGRVYGKEGT